MQKWDPERMEKSTRDINSVAAAIEIREGRGSRNGGTYLSLRHLPRNLVEFSLEWFPSNIRGWRAAGAFRVLDYLGNMTEDAWEVAPACHFWNGGIRIDERCATSIPGLYAAGEGTAGIHGANRLAGNALTQVVVWGRRAGCHAAEFAQKCGHRGLPDDQVDRLSAKISGFSRKSGAGPSVVEMRREIRRIAGELVGIVREEPALKKALEAIDAARPSLEQQRVHNEQLGFNRELVEALQNENMLDVLEAVARASLRRQESRGAMYRLDYPLTDDSRWLSNIMLRCCDGRWSMEEQPVKEIYVPLPKGRHVYGRRAKAANE